MRTHSPTVVAGVDGSEPAAAAARAAALEADRRRLPLRLVRAFHWPAGDVPGLPDAYEACAAARRSANADLERLRRSLAGHLPDWAISVQLLDGRPETALCRATQPGDLLVIGASGLTWGSGDVLGSVAEAVAATAACPVLVHRSPNLLGPRRSGVVVGVDGAAGSREVLAAAATEAQLRGEPVRVVHAWRQLTEDAVHPLRWRLDVQASVDAESAAVEPMVAELRRRHPDLTIDTEVRRGRAGQVLVEATGNAVLLVVGRQDLAHGGPGATVHSVLHRVEIPVLTVPVAIPAPRPAEPIRRAAVVTGPLEG
ncbi:MULTISPECIES: universal stress protein [unclassified Modestobacter]|uniref:universal stress protein n=1 Tax=unclassified Modestobacter TaxID=2643866 RepID=UPI0022AA477A|nr:MULTISPECIES: universal stress protein [unclassified Modestobacter]MCZ2812074.1 universal stress protein [Modestobacter sp. VKM Ac-2979]MCZ2843798.1 universal stress protein [Modestobacter sp. VKM Ac-2980]MCZ2849756.1 universal stress protein [Modestobacter sp. VKM Ac-2978]